MENLNQIIKQFPEVGEVKEVKALTSGLINQTYLVKLSIPKKLITYYNVSTIRYLPTSTCYSTTSKW